MTPPVAFKKQDVKRAIAAVAAAGLKVAGVKFPPDGGFKILTADAAEKPKADAEREIVL